MSYFRNLLQAILGRPKRRTASMTAFPGADVSRLTQDWTIDPGAINRWLRFELRTLRARSRQLTRGDGYGAKFVRSCVSNIAGPKPFQLQAKIRKSRASPMMGEVMLDSDANKTLERAYADWSRAGNCEVTGKLNLSELHRLAVRNLARDGETLIRILRGRTAGPYGMQLQVLDIDRLDEDRNSEDLRRGAIKMGVEVNEVGKPVAYHLFRRHPGETGLWGRGEQREYEIVPADDIIHLFIPEWPEQARGAPWIAAGMTRLYHLGGFEEAAVIAARIGASQMMMLEQSEQSAPLSSIADTPTGAPQTPQVNVSPGTAQALPYGWKVASGWDPKFPDAAVEPFIRSTLRGIAASVGMAYHTLANDPSNVNYSTARVALLEERDMWSSIQDWYIAHFCERVFPEFIGNAVLMGKLPREFLTQERYRDVQWQPKRWAWVDPKSDTDANIASLHEGLTSRTRVLAAQGEDFEDIANELAEEQALLDELEIELGDPNKKPAEPAAQPAAPAANDSGDKALEAMHDDVRRLIGERSNVTPLPTRFELIVNQAPVTLTVPGGGAPVVRNEITLPEREVNIDTGDVHVTTPGVRVETPVTVNPAAVSIPISVQPAEVRNEVNVQPAEVRNEITVESPDVTVPVTVEGAKVTVEPQEINVAPADVRIEMPRYSEVDEESTIERNPQTLEVERIRKRVKRRK